MQDFFRPRKKKCFQIRFILDVSRILSMLLNPMNIQYSILRGLGSGKRDSNLDTVIPRIDLFSLGGLFSHFQPRDIR